jgi:hypothetical protein
MRTQLKRGSRVTIYEDPITKTKPEGEAKLVKQISYDPQCERWYVDFGDGIKIVRVIFP